MRSSCFICVQPILRRRGRLFPESKVKLQSLLTTICKLLKVASVTDQDWDFVETCEEPVCCGNCFKALLSVKENYDILVETEEKLKKCLEQVQSAVRESGKADKADISEWRPTCFKFRQHFTNFGKNNGLNVHSFNTDDCASQTASKPTPLSIDFPHDASQDWEDDWQNDGGPDNEIEETYQQLKPHKKKRKILVISEEDDVSTEPSQTYSGVAGPVQKLRQLDNKFTAQPSNKIRRFHEDSFKPIAYPNSGSFEVPASISLSPSAAKSGKAVVSHEEPAKRTSPRRSSVPNRVIPVDNIKEEQEIGNDDNWNDVEISLEHSEESENEEHSLNAKELLHARKLGIGRKDALALTETERQSLSEGGDEISTNSVLRRRGQKPYLDLEPGIPPKSKVVMRKAPKINKQPLLMINDHLFLLRMRHFIEFNWTHLICKAVNCDYQVKYIDLASFEAIRQHIDENHRGHMYRRKCQVECLICGLMCRRQFNFQHHLKAAHSDLLPPKGKGMCEICFKPCHYHRTITHEYIHKSPEELEEARRLGIGPRVALALKESEKSALAGLPTRKAHPKPTVTAVEKAGIEAQKQPKRFSNPPYFLIVNENLLLYQLKIFVGFTSSHLTCKAVNCEFQVPFDYYHSFNSMHKHIKECHTGIRYHRYKKVKCDVCETIFPKQYYFKHHFRTVHKDLCPPAGKGICEICLRPTRVVHLDQHRHTHKNAQELAEAEGKGVTLPVRCKAMLGESKESDEEEQEGKSLDDDGFFIPEIPAKPVIKKPKPVRKPTPGASTYPTVKKRKGEWKVKDNEGNPVLIGKGMVLPFMVVNPNLFLYKRSTFVEYNYTHLICKAMDCNFQTPFDYYPSFQVMRAHLRDKHSGLHFRRHGQRICLLCNTTIQRARDFLIHLNTKHPELHPRNVQGLCECCLKTGRYQTIAVHQASHKNAEELQVSKEMGVERLPKSYKYPTVNKFKCTTKGCDYSTHHLSRFRGHTYTHMAMEERPDTSICQECGNRVLQSTLDAHMLRFHRPDLVKDVISCPECDMKFLAKDKYRLQQHLKVHSGEKSFMCEECGKSFFHKSNLTNHMKCVHQGSEFCCEQCGQVMKMMAYRKHWRTHHKNLQFPLLKMQPHPKVPEEDRFYKRWEKEKKVKAMMPKRKWPCDQCDVVCCEKHVLDRHKLRIHQGIDTHAKWKKKKRKTEPVVVNNMV